MLVDEPTVAVSSTRRAAMSCRLPAEKKHEQATRTMPGLRRTRRLFKDFK
jgi:hypothetical protein